MGKPMNIFATQTKERARQQRQTDKAAKRMLTRRKKTFLATSVPLAHLDTAGSKLTGRIVESAD